jgi:hypothetical protein
MRVPLLLVLLAGPSTNGSEVFCGDDHVWHPAPAGTCNADAGSP